MSDLNELGKLRLARAIEEIRKRAIPRPPDFALDRIKKDKPIPTALVAVESVSLGRRLRFQLVLAASILIATTVAVLLRVQGVSNVAFAETLLLLDNIESVDFQIRHETDSKILKQIDCKIDDGRVRNDFGDGVVSIVDTKTESGILLYSGPVSGNEPPKKVASRLPVSLDRPRNARTSIPDPISRLQGIRPSDAKFVAKEQLGGEIVSHFQCPTASIDIWGHNQDQVVHSYQSEVTMDIWISEIDGLPVRVEFSNAENTDRIVLDRIQWSPTFNPVLFSLEVPSGYIECSYDDLMEILKSKMPSETRGEK